MQFTDQFCRSVIENMINGFAFHRIVTDENGKPVDYEYIEINTAFESYTGLKREYVIGRTIREISPDIDKDDTDWIALYGDVALNGSSASIEQYSAVFDRWYTIHAYSPDKGYFVTIFNDITTLKKHEEQLKQQNESLSKLYEEQTTLYEELMASEEELKENFERLSKSVEENKKQQEKLEYLAYHDALTELPNRTLFMDRLNIAIGLSQRCGLKSMVVFMDIDNFKDVNDTLGHNVGDMLLKAIAQRLSQQMRGHDTIARLGGDEFSLLIQNIMDQKEAYDFCERIKEELAEPFIFDGHSFHVNASIGIALHPEDGTTAEELLKNADTAMYRAKSLGKNNIQFFREDMKQDMLRRLAIEKNLRRALEKEEFLLYYQPQIEIGTGNVRSLEALLRWNNSELGAVSPIEFIPVAEDTGLIVLLGEWVLREACKQGAEWNHICSPGLLISVNISAVQLKQANFAGKVKDILKKTGFLPEHLELEITESLLINSFEQTAAMLEELRAIGVRVSMDDFGTGYSSLNYLKQLPLNTLKIDKSFIRDIEAESVEKEIAGAIVSLVHKLHIEVVAEGVETENQLDYLIECNCDNIQGYLLSKPVPAEEVPVIMKKNFREIINRGR